MSARTEELAPGSPHKAKPEKSSNGDGVAKAESVVRIEIRTSTCFRVAKINANFSAKILSGIRIRCALRVEIAAASRGRNCSCFPLTKAVRRLLKRKKKSSPRSSPGYKRQPTDLKFETSCMCARVGPDADFFYSRFHDKTFTRLIHTSTRRRAAGLANNAAGYFTFGSNRLGAIEL